MDMCCIMYSMLLYTFYIIIQRTRENDTQKHTFIAYGIYMPAHIYTITGAGKFSTRIKVFLTRSRDKFVHRPSYSLPHLHNYIMILYQSLFLYPVYHPNTYNKIVARTSNMYAHDETFRSNFFNNSSG